MKIVYSRRALREVERIARAIALDNERAADEFVNHLQHRCGLLVGTPEMGPARPEIGSAIRSLVYGNYSIFYRLKPKVGEVVIVSVWHSRRLPPRL